MLALSTAAADRLGIPDPAFVEKDYWVVELLRSVARPVTLVRAETPVVAFKGGTSLSKAFGLITRFSEDVDILVHTSGLGKTAVSNQVLKPICERARADLGLTDDQVHVVSSETGVHRDVDYAYPRMVDSTAIRAGVRLEMGTRGGTMPGLQTRFVTSYIADYLDLIEDDEHWDERSPVSIAVVPPVRTLVEKLCLVHDAACRAAAGEAANLGRAGRHYYDIHHLLSDREVRRALEQPGLVQMLTDDIHACGSAFNASPAARPVGGFAMSPAFYDSTPEVRRVAESGYADAMPLVWGDKPTFADCIATVQDAAALL